MRVVLKKIVVGSSDQHFDKLTVSHHEGQVIINSTAGVKTSSIAMHHLFRTSFTWMIRIYDHIQQEK